MIHVVPRLTSDFLAVVHFQLGERHVFETLDVAYDEGGGGLVRRIKEEGGCWVGGAGCFAPTENTQARENWNLELAWSFLRNTIYLNGKF